MSKERGPGNQPNWDSLQLAKAQGKEMVLKVHRSCFHYLIAWLPCLFLHLGPLATYAACILLLTQDLFL